MRSHSPRPQLQPTSIIITRHTNPAAESRLSTSPPFPRALSLPHADDWITRTIFITSLSYPRSGLISPLLFLPDTDSTCIQGLSSIPSSPTKRTSPSCPLHLTPPHLGSLPSVLPSQLSESSLTHPAQTGFTQALSSPNDFL